MPSTAPPTRTAPPAPDIRRDELRATVRLAIPVVAVQVGMMLMGAVDTLMVGRVSAEVLAGVALGNLYFFNVSVFGVGTLMAVDPIISQAMGAREPAVVSRAVQRGLLLAFLLSLALALLLVPAGPVLRAAGQPAEIIGDATSYLHISIPGLPAFLGFVVLRQALQAMHRVAPVVWTIIGANLANVVLNWVFIYGNLGVPPMGVRGSAIATLLSRVAMFVLLLVMARRQLLPLLHPLQPGLRDWAAMRSLLRLGAPIGGQQTLEVAAFGAIGLLMGVIGTHAMAAHQIAITLAALAFMVPLGVASAASVRVGHAVGAGDAPRARAAVRAAYLCGVGFMACTALLFLIAPRPLAMLFTRDVAVVALAATLLPIAGVFQVFDGGQAVGAGVLRGLGDTTVPLAVMLGGYWIIGLPVSAWLGFRTSMGAPGLWWGFVASLGIVAVLLFIRIRILFGRELQRVQLSGWR
jgi:multidrug resistance protein, MATE family